MSIKVNTNIVLTIFVLVQFGLGPGAYGQEPKPPAPSQAEPITDKEKTEKEKTDKDNADKPKPEPLAAFTAPLKPTQAPAAAGKPATPPPVPDFWHQEEMTGNWGGVRSKWKDK